MSSEEAPKSHAALKILLKFAFNVLIVFVMSEYLEEYFLLEGGVIGMVIIGALITLLNMFFRPIINLITLPMRFFATIVAIAIVNGLFIYVVHLITVRMDPTLVRLEIFGGPWGWIVVASCFGLANWMMKETFK